MDNLIIIKGGNIHFPKAYFRGNSSMVHFSPTNFITPAGILFPLDFYSFALNDYLQGGIKAVKTMDVVLKGVLLGPDRTIYEVTVKRCSGDELDIEVMTPMQYEPDVVYARGSDPTMDVIGSVGLEEDYDPVDILVAASKLSNLNRNHYSIQPINKYYEVIERMRSLRNKKLVPA